MRVCTNEKGRIREEERKGAERDQNVRKQRDEQRMQKRGKVRYIGWVYFSERKRTNSN